MKEVSMTTISRGGNTIPGGWSVKVPEVTVAEEDLVRYIRYLTRHGWRLQEAEEFIRDSFQRTFERGWMVGLREMLGDRAAAFVAMGGEMQDFDPCVISASYVPFENRGRPGKPAVRRLLVEMKEDARDPKEVFVPESALDRYRRSEPDG